MWAAGCSTVGSDFSEDVGQCAFDFCPLSPPRGQSWGQPDQCVLLMQSAVLFISPCSRLTVYSEQHWVFVVQTAFWPASLVQTNASEPG